MTLVTLGLGANRPNKTCPPEETLLNAVRELSAFVSGIQVSSVYKTGALYVTDQADFYNLVVRGNTTLSAKELLSCVNAIENRFGRKRADEIRNGPRTLDIDIELYGDKVVHEKNLIIPHEKMLERAFVLVPLVEILQNSADTQRSGLALYKSCLERETVRSQKIERFMPAQEFKAKLEQPA